MAQKLEKQPFEELFIEFNFARHVRDGLSITAVEAITASPAGDPDDLDVGTAGSWTFSGLVARTMVKRGRNGVAYKVDCRIALSSGERAELDGTLWVIERPV